MAFKVKNIFITGGNRGVGFGMVTKMLQDFDPDHLFATYRDASNSQELLELSKNHKNLHPIQLDVTDYAKLPRVVNEVDSITNGGGINLFINNSGILGRDCNGIRDITRDDMLSHLEINTMGPVLLTQAFLPLLEKGEKLNADQPHGIRRAAIVNTSTRYASIGDNSSGGSYSYRFSKAALNMATKCMSLELKSTGITTVLIHPGWVKTDMGSQNAPMTVSESVGHIINTLREVTIEDNGKFLSFDGKEIPW